MSLLHGDTRELEVPDASATVVTGKRAYIYCVYVCTYKRMHCVCFTLKPVVLEKMTGIQHFSKRNGAFFLLQLLGRPEFVNRRTVAERT